MAEVYSRASALATRRARHSGSAPVDPLTASGAKLFASTYALFSGLVFVGILGVLLAPFIHRIMHRLPIDDDAATR